MFALVALHSNFCDHSIASGSLESINEHKTIDEMYTMRIADSMPMRKRRGLLSYLVMP